MENNENNFQNEVNQTENNVNTVQENKKERKNGKGKTIALMVIVLVLVLAVGVLAGVMFSEVSKQEGVKPIVEKAENQIKPNEEDAAKDESSTQTVEKKQVSRVEYKTNSYEDKISISVYGYDSNGVEVWNYTTIEGNNYQYLNTEEIGENDNKIYLNESGTIVALDRNTGKVLWKNSEYNGYESYAHTFGNNGYLYLAPMNGPRLFIVDKNGKTVKKFDGNTITVEGTPKSINIDSQKNELKMYFSVPTAISEHTKVVTMKLSDYTYTVSEENQNSNYKYDENGFIIIEDYSGASSFWGKWESEECSTEIKIGKDDVFMMDHYTKSSEVFGTCKINRDKIELIGENGQKWNGQLLAQKNEEDFVLKVNIDGKNYIFYCTDHNYNLVQKAQ